MSISIAKNTSSPKQMYEGRSAYKDAFPKNDIQFDTGYTNRLFGKVDTYGNILQINEGFLSFFGASYDKTSAACLNFVADAFLDARKEYKELVLRQKINTSSPYFKEDLSVFKSWEKQELLFSQNSDSFYFSLLDYITANKFKIKNFETYVEYALKFAEGKKLPLTRIGFYESILNPVHTTGIVIELYNGDASDDSIREEYISDVNYDFMSELFAKRGLRFDTQVPWRLIANLQSDNLKKFLLPYLKTLDFKIQDIFDKFYFKSFQGAFFTSFQEFKSTLKNFYIGYINIYPSYNEFTYRPSSIKQVFKKSTQYYKCSGIQSVPTYSSEIMFKPDSKEEDLFFLELYYKFRIIETEIQLSEVLKKFHLDNSRSLYLYNKNRQKGIEKALEYINYNLGTLAFRSPSVDEINLTRTGNNATM